MTTNYDMRIVVNHNDVVITIMRDLNEIKNTKWDDG